MIKHPKRLATIRQAASIYPAFSTSTLRWLVFNEKTNGFSVCVRRLGRKILLDLDVFEQWVDSRGGAQ